MTQQQRAPEPYGEAWQTWGRRLMQYLAQVRSALVQQTGGESAAEDGTIMWDRVNKYPVVSKNGAWREIVLSDGQYEGTITTDQTVALINTPYALTYTSTSVDGISNGTPPSRLVFEEGGKFLVNFSAQISSASSSTVSFYFWPRLNGVDVAGSTMVAALHRNNATTVVSRSLAVVVNAGDYLEAFWAVDAAGGRLEATPATAFSPAAPATTIGITRLHG